MRIDGEFSVRRECYDKNGRNQIKKTRNQNTNSQRRNRNIFSGTIGSVRMRMTRNLGPVTQRVPIFEGVEASERERDADHRGPQSVAPECECSIRVS